MSDRASGELVPTPAPDVAGTIDAWRVWRIVARDGGYVLGSVIKPTLWLPRQPLCAECLRPRSPLARLRRTERHGAPEALCECGVYGAGLEQLHQYLNENWMEPPVARVVGEVALWGTVVECDRGFRASHAYPLRIFVPSDARYSHDRADDVVEGLAGYGVPVELLGASRSDALEVLAREAA